MDARHRKLYLKWGQSDRIELLVGESTGSPKTFLLPVDFLRQRSRTFRKLLTVQAEGSISLPETPVLTFEDFFIWTFSPQPKVDPGATFTEVVQLGIFAWRYQISALSNQVTDVIRSKIADRDWSLQASIVDDIYEAVPSGSPLREVVRAALSQLPRPNAEGEVLKDEWKATFLKHAALGWDYIQAGATEWTVKDYLSDPCAFHDHQGVSHHGSFASCDGCPYSQEDCYPDLKDGDADKVNGLPTGDEESQATVEEVVAEQEPLTNGTAAHEEEVPAVTEHEEVNDAEELVEKLDGIALEEPEIDTAEVPEDAADDEINGTKESDSVADIDRATVASEEVNGAKDDETIVEEVNGTNSHEDDHAAEVNGVRKETDMVLEEVEDATAEKAADTPMERGHSGETKTKTNRKKGKRKNTK